MNPKIERFTFPPCPYGTFGILTVKDFRCYTVERPWLDNQPNISCIPEGEYEMVLSYFHKGGYPAYEIIGIPGRTEIKIHVANTMDDVIGCVGVGEGLGYIKGKWSVTYSKMAYKAFMPAMAGIKRARITVGRVEI